MSGFVGYVEFLGWKGCTKVLGRGIPQLYNVYHQVGLFEVLKNLSFFGVLTQIMHAFVILVVLHGFVRPSFTRRPEMLWEFLHGESYTMQRTIMVNVMR